MNRSAEGRLLPAGRKNSQFIAAMFIALYAAVFLTSCGSTPSGNTAVTPPETFVQTLDGDSATYGLACEGCNDTLLILLCNLEQAPDTFNILEASCLRRVMGYPKTGDLVAAVTIGTHTPQTPDTLRQKHEAQNLTSATHHPTARMVIDISQLKGKWCYEVMPQLRRRADVSEEMRQNFMNNMPDSVRKRLLQPREYGFELKGDFTAMPVGHRRQGEDVNGPVEYPAQRRYHEWHLLNGKLLLSEAQPDQDGNLKVTVTDTADFVRLRRDTLELRFNDGTQRLYYRK